MSVILSRCRFILWWIPFFILFCALGQWQIARYHFKQNWVAAASLRLSKKPVEFEKVRSGSIAPDMFRRVKFQGEYQNDSIILVQNQFYQHKSGVKILTPVRIPGDSRFLLVDRGWHVLESPVRAPPIVPVTGMQIFHGHIRPPVEYQFILGSNIPYPSKRPLWIQRVNIAELSRVFKADFYPFVVQLDPGVSGGFVTEMHTHLTLPMPPQRHLGYAFQWFAMAAVLVLACLYFAARKEKG